MSRDQDEVSAILAAAAAQREEEVPNKSSNPTQEEITQVQFLSKLFNVLDIKLNLYFTNHTASADLDKILVELSTIVHKKLTISVILQILYLWPESFKVCETTNGRYLINLPDMKLNSMEQRKLKFLQLLQKWCLENDDEPVPCSTIDETINDPLNNKIKIMRNSNKRLKNNSQNFNFKEKIEDDSKSMTLLERIKLKERKKKLEIPLIPVDSKLESIYNILFSLQIANRNNNYTLLNLNQKIKDSYKTTIHEDDILSSLTKLSQITDKIQIVEVNNLKVVKFDKLNRDHDLAIIKSLYDEKIQRTFK